MKKFLILFVIVIVIVSIIAVRYSSYKVEQDTIMQENAEFEQYKDKEIYGLDLATIINKVMDKNIKNEISKDDKGMFIENDTNSIKVYVKFKYKDDYTTLEIEKILQNGTDNFIKTYGTASFKGEEISYHEKTGNVKAIVFTET